MRFSRRDLTFGTLALGAGLGACERPRSPQTNVVNDITQLNPIEVDRIVTPTTVEDIRDLVGSNSGPVSIGGGRFSQGGQVACDGALFIDMRGVNRIVAIDAADRSITVEAGATWRQIQEALDPLDLSPAIMQSFSNFTVGGSLSVNCHGDYVGCGPIVESVRAIRVVMADGRVKTASRAENPDLFSAAIGGYGGVGVVAEATLDVAQNVRLRRETHRMKAESYVTWRRANVAEANGAVLHHAVIYPTDYSDVAAEVSSITDDPLTITDRLAPLGPPSVAERSVLDVVTHTPVGPFLHEHIYDPLMSQPEVVWRNYEAARDAYSLEPASRTQTTYVLQEYFVPVDRFSAFVSKMAQIFQTSGANILNVSIRHSRPDTTTLLSWAREEVYAFVIYYAQGTDNASKAAVRAWTLSLIDAAIDESGSYYLPYQIHASREQFLKAYPRADAFFDAKGRYDPLNKFRNRLWEAYYVDNAR
jgi:FAD/FMN-containing dehydrogenase